MRKKALLVGALGPFSGPWVNLEEGSWAIAGPIPPEVIIELGIQSIPVNRLENIPGPTRIRACIKGKTSEPIYLQVRKVG